MDITIDRIMQNFDVLTDWEDRYRYIIELGRKLPPFDEEYKIDDNLVRGMCEPGVARNRCARWRSPGDRISRR